ncbi:MAG: hypothetical protein JRI55_39250, partial [Deltaproteobacteria bacterium]|nr:hypothetical protein [Deltaproteobacteria bacterium]
MIPANTPAALALAACLAALGCEPVHRQQACRMEGEVVLARYGAKPEAVAVDRLVTGDHLAAWSASGATYSLLLDERGHPLEDRPRRITRGQGNAALDLAEYPPKTFWADETSASPDAVHLALSTWDQGAAVAMLERSGPAGPGGAFLALYDRDGRP